eukprot:1528831-Pleurochrysis_carterae.AAC.1
MATDLTQNPSALRTGWKPLPASKPKPTASATAGVAAARGGVRGSGRGGGRGSGRGRSAFVDAFSRFGNSAAEPPTTEGVAAEAEAAAISGVSTTQTAPVFDRTPTQLELACDPADLAQIRAAFPLHADLILNSLLSFDGLLSLWFHVKEPIIYMAPEAERAARALGTCRKSNALSPKLGDAHLQAIFYHEIIKRVSQRANKSLYIHGFLVKVPRVQPAIGDESAVGISALELQNAETKRTATKNATKHVECT